MASGVNVPTRAALEYLNQKYRVPGVLPLSINARSITGSADDSAAFKVDDELIRALRFVAVDRPYAKQYNVKVNEALAEPAFAEDAAAPPADAAWTAGATTAYGQELAAGYSVAKNTFDAFYSFRWRGVEGGGDGAGKAESAGIGPEHGMGRRSQGGLGQWRPGFAVAVGWNVVATSQDSTR